MTKNVLMKEAQEQAYIYTGIVVIGMVIVDLLVLLVYEKKQILKHDIINKGTTFLFMKKKGRKLKMSKTNKIVIMAVLAAILLLGIGYAAIQNIALNISGTAAADPSQENFKVMFTGTPEVSDSTYVTAGITNDTNATINVSGLTKKGEKVSATYTVQNTSTDLSADLLLATTNSNTEYFTISSNLDKTSLTAGEATTVTVTAELIKTPLEESVSSTVGIQLTAIPVQPGEEGTESGV